MSHRLPALPLVACLAIAIAGAGAGAGAQTPDPALEHARAAATAYREALRETLEAAIRQRGTAAAIDVCRDEAPRLATEIGAAHGVRIGRVPVTGRARNPANAARGWQAEALARFTDAVAAGAPAAEQLHVQRDGLTEGVLLGLARGIPTEPTCLACHGAAIGADVAAALARNYPDDRATGFAPGDLRGLLWVEVTDPPADIPTDRSAP